MKSNGKKRLEAFTKTNLFKLLVFFFVFLVLIGIASILFIRSLQFWAVPFLRALYITIAVVWAVGSIWGVAVWFDFKKYWQGYKSDRWADEESFGREIYVQYQELKDEYPAALSEFESHCWREDPRPTVPEIMERAMQIPASEWDVREVEAKEKQAQRHARRLAK